MRVRALRASESGCKCQACGRFGGVRSFWGRAQFEWLAQLLGCEPGRPLTCEAIASSQDIPFRFLKSVVGELRKAGLVRSQRGCEGGYWLDTRFDTKPWLMIIFLLFGVAAGFKGMRRAAREANRASK